MSRRRFLATSAATLAAGWALSGLAGPTVTAAGDVGVLDATVPGGIDLHLASSRVSVGGRLGTGITINGTMPGPVIRMREGREALIRVHNHLPESSSIHWHGILLPYTMDGVPGISFAGIPAGETFTYRYSLRQNGTYWYHSHSGLQEQLGHYGMIIVEPAEPDPVAYDLEYPIVLSDWTFENPHAIMRKLKTMEGYYNFQRPTLANIDQQMAMEGKTRREVIASRVAWQQMRMDQTDIADVTGATYTYLMNGKAANENPTLTAEPGQCVRLRLVNASSMTYFDFRIPGLPMTVVHADGQNVKPVETDELRIAVAETYDVIVTLPDDRAYTLFAETMDRSGFASGTIAPRAGMSATLPARRQRPWLTMADMGMMHDMDGMGGMKGHDMAMPGMQHGAAASKPDHDMAAMDHSKMTDAMPGMDHSAHASHDMSAPTPGTLPIAGLPDSVSHGPDLHGVAGTTMAGMASRQLYDPGTGLGDDDWRVLTYGQLRCLRTPSDRRPPTREIDLHLTGNMHKYIWGFDGKTWSESDMLQFQYGERLRLNLINDTMMTHPIHLHGMWLDLYAGHDYADNPRKHTVSVQPAELLTVDITADAPGQWAFHCHLLYHMEAGMARTVAVVRDLTGGPIHAKP